MLVLDLNKTTLDMYVLNLFCHARAKHGNSGFFSTNNEARLLKANCLVDGHSRYRSPKTVVMSVKFHNSTRQLEFSHHHELVVWNDIFE